MGRWEEVERRKKKVTRRALIPDDDDSENRLEAWKQMLHSHSASVHCTKKKTEHPSNISGTLKNAKGQRLFWMKQSTNPMIRPKPAPC